MGRDDMMELDDKGKFKDRDLMTKFYRRFPQLKAMPQVSVFYREKGTDAMKVGHPIHDFVVRYKALRKKGYSEYKAFSTVESELKQVLDSQLDETRILRGTAMAAHGESYLDRSQRVAELESEMKMMRFIRDMPKHERSQAHYIKQLQEELDAATGHEESEAES